MTQESVVFALAAGLFIVFSLTLHNFLTPGNLIALVRSVSILGILGLGMGLVVIGRGHRSGDGRDHGRRGRPGCLSLTTHSGRARWLGACCIGAVFVDCRRIDQRHPHRLRRCPGDLHHAWPWAGGLWRRPRLAVPGRCPEHADEFGVLRFSRLAPRSSACPCRSSPSRLSRWCVWAVLRWTRFGRFVYASGDNPSAARIAGVPLRPLIVAAICHHRRSSPMRPASSWRRPSRGMSTRVYNSTMIYDVLLVVVLGGIGLSGGRGGVRNVLVGTCWSACCSTA